MSISRSFSQQERVNELRDVDIKEEPNGNSRDLGREIDLVLGMKVTNNIKVEIISAIFYPGDAFDESDAALFGEAKVRFLF